MTQYALVIDGQSVEFRDYPQRPSDIPHKKVAWYPVFRGFGEPFEGLENGVWVVRTVDPATLPPSVPEFITRRQCALELYARRIVTLEEALAMTRTAEAPPAISAVFAELPPEQRMLAQIDFAAANYNRASSLLSGLGFTRGQIDDFFIAAAQL